MYSINIICTIYSKPASEKMLKICIYLRKVRSKVSDIDILVEFSDPVEWEFIDLKEFLDSLLEVKVDLVTKNALKPQIRDRILNEVVYA